MALARPQGPLRKDSPLWPLDENKRGPPTALTATLPLAVAEVGMAWIDSCWWLPGAVVVPEVLKHKPVLVKANALELLPRQGCPPAPAGPLRRSRELVLLWNGLAESPDF